MVALMALTTVLTSKMQIKKIHGDELMFVMMTEMEMVLKMTMTIALVANADQRFRRKWNRYL